MFLQGSVVGICGGVGSGKSSLLSALLGQVSSDFKDMNKSIKEAFSVSLTHTRTHVIEGFLLICFFFFLSTFSIVLLCYR